MAEFVSPASVRTALGPGATTMSDEFLSSLIVRAEARLRAQVARLSDRVAASEVDIELVRSVLLDVIVPIARNPEGYVAKAVGEVSRTWGSGGSETRMVFDPADLELLRPASNPVRSATMSVPAWRLP